MSHVTLITTSGGGSTQPRVTRPANGSADTARAGASDLVVSLAGEIVTQRPASIDEKASAAAAQFPAVHLASQLAISTPEISPAEAIRKAKEVISYREARLHPLGKNNEQLIVEMAEQKKLSDHIVKVAKTLRTQFTDMSDNQAIAEAVAAIMHRGYQMSLIEEIRKSSEGATKVRARVVAEITRIEGEISGLELERAAINRSPMQKDDYLQYILADVDARFEVAAGKRTRQILNLFSTEGAESMRTSSSPPTIDGTANFRRASGGMWSTEAIFGKLDGYGTTYDMYCFLCRDSVKKSIQEMFEKIEWPFDNDGAAGADDVHRYKKEGLINLVAAKPLAVLAQEAEKISDKIRDLTKQRDALLEEAELRGFAL